MNILKRFVSGLGQQTAPFGFAPNDPEASYKAGLGYIGDVGANLMANNQGGVDPFANLGASLQQAKAQGVDRNKEQYSARLMMEQAEENRRKRDEEAAAKEQRNQWLMSISDPNMRATLQANPQLIDNYVMATDPAFQTADASGGAGNWGMSVVPLRNRQTGELVAGQFNQGQGGIFINGQPADPGQWEYDPGALAEDKAAGTLAGGAPGKVVDQYTSPNGIRSQMSALSDTVMTMREAKKFLSQGIQTGSMSDALQALRSLGAQLGFNVDENVLSNTQSYQNFIGNVVIPRMAALGGNDSNEELRKLFSLSGGDISQSLTALNNTLDFMERLFERKFRSFKSVEDVALQFLPGLEPVPFAYDSGGNNSVVIDGYTIEEE